MKIKINQRELSKSISIAQRGITNRSPLQILDGILLEASDDKLKITGTDLDLTIETYVDCEIIEPGSIIINSRIFGDIVRKLPNDIIDIDVNEDNNVNIICKNSEFNIQGNDSKEYPMIPIVKEDESFYLSKELLKSAIKHTVFATSQDDSRPTLRGVLLEIKDGVMSFVALDGYRLALKTMDVPLDLELKMIIPGSALNEINKIVDDSEENIKVISSEKNIIFDVGDTRIYSTLLDGQFFNYKDIIRENHETSVIVNKSEFQNALERASLLAKEEKANLIKLEIKDNMITILSNSEIGNVHEEIPVEIEGIDVYIAFNARYILDGIKNMESEDIELNFMGELSPCIIEPTEERDYIYLVLPVRARD